MTNRWNVVSLPVIAALLCVLCARSLAEVKPNFVLILGEGHGWSSTSVPMDDAAPESKSDFVRTPNLANLAQDGMRFARFYASSPRCTPSRAALLTGKSPAQLHMTFVGEGRMDDTANSGRKVLTPRGLLELPDAETTLAELLKRAGYATAHFGKWHLGRISPSRHGFDESDGPTSNGGPENVANPHPKQLFGMTERGMDFMARQVQAGKPFYLQLSHYASRHLADVRPETMATVRSWTGSADDRILGEAAAMLDLDIALGMLLDKLDQLGLATNTYVIFTTDHGSPGRNPPLAGGKGTVSEGGLRVPFIIRGPGIRAGACTRVRATGVDLLPTIAELARVIGPLPQGLEGGSLAPVLMHGGEGEVQRPRKEFVFHFPHYDKDALGPASAILLGDFKLIRVYETDALSLFNITKDPAERHDLAQELPDQARALNQRLTDYLTAVNTQMPTPNSNHVTGQPVELKRGVNRKGRQ